jgi:hypothetical protein
MIVLLSIGAVSLIGIISATTTYHFFGVGVVAQGQGGLPSLFMALIFQQQKMITELIKKISSDPKI